MTETKDKNAKQHYLGHRQRVKRSFLAAEAEITKSSDLLEMALYVVYPRQDVKPLVKKILHVFKNIRRFVNASLEELEKKIANDDNFTIPGKSTISNLYFVAKLLREITLRISKEKMEEPDTTVFSSHEEVITYLRHKFGNLSQEHFSVIFLAANNRIIEISTCSIGTINEVHVYDREIVKKGLNIGAVSIILVHNHFSGNPEPSKADRDITLQISEACERFGIAVLDHIIITNDSYFSFREKNIQLQILRP